MTCMQKHKKFIHTIEIPKLVLGLRIIYMIVVLMRKSSRHLALAMHQRKILSLILIY